MKKIFALIFAALIAVLCVSVAWADGEYEWPTKKMVLHPLTEEQVRNEEIPTTLYFDQCGVNSLASYTLDLLEQCSDDGTITAAIKEATSGTDKSVCATNDIVIIVGRLGEIDAPYDTIGFKTGNLVHLRWNKDSQDGSGNAFGGPAIVNNKRPTGNTLYYYATIDNSEKLPDNSEKLPDTGDKSTPVLWATLSFLGIAGMMIVMNKKREAA